MSKHDGGASADCVVPIQPRRSGQAPQQPSPAEEPGAVEDARQRLSRVGRRHQRPVGPRPAVEAVQLSRDVVLVAGASRVRPK